MNDTQALETLMTKLQDVLLADNVRGRSRLLLQVMRMLAQGEPVFKRQVDRIIADIGMEREEAHAFLRQVTERNADDDIVGIIGLSLNEHPHRFHINGVTLSAWCAADTLFLPAMLQQTATIDSYSPLSNEKIQLTVSPGGVEDVHPSSAVVSIVTVEPQQANVASVEVIWSTFCEQIHFFATREEAERWATSRNNIAIVTVDEAFDLLQHGWAKVLAYA